MTRRPALSPVAVAAVALLLTVAASCSKQAKSPSPQTRPQSPPQAVGGKPQGHVYTGVGGEPGDVNPYTSHDWAARRLVFAYTHEGLLGRDPATGGLRPALAEHVEEDPDGRACTFTLRAGVHFADGSPMTMADVLFGWELAAAGHLAMGQVTDAFGRVAAAEALDDRRLRVTFRDVHYAAVGTVGEGWLVGSRRHFERAVRARLHDGEAMPEVGSVRFAEVLASIKEDCGPGTGPYRLCVADDATSHWHRRQEILLGRNEHCWRRKVEPGTWNFAGIRTLFRDPTGAVNELLSGRLDWFSSPAVDELLASRPALAEHYRRLAYDYDQLGAFRIVWNCKRGPLVDVTVRRALAHLADRQAMVAVFRGAASPAVAHAKPGQLGHPGREPVAFDVAAARRLLREAGYDPAAGKPLRLVLVVLEGSEPLRRLSELFLAAARSAGIEIDLRPRDVPGLVREKTIGEWHGLFVLQSFRGNGDPFDFVHSEGTDNAGGYHNAEVDELAETARRTLEPQARGALWRRMHTIVDDEQPVTLLVHPQVTMLLHRRVEDVVPGPIGLVPERAWVAPDRQRP
jgi:peptide/nickel transport system substrate-binding protein